MIETAGRKPTASRGRNARSRLGLGLAAAALGLAYCGTARADWLGDLQSPFEQALASGEVGIALGLSLLTGLATSLTPCVYPMIGITVSVFGARSSSSRLQGAALSAVFVLGMASLFTPLGLVAAVTGGAFGSSLANPWVLAGLGLVFGALAFSMFGAFSLDLPTSLKTRLSDVGGGGYGGSFLLGMVTALIAAPCTGPVLSALLAWVGTSGDLWLGGSALFAYAIGLGLPFWLVGTFSINLPKSGRWLGSVKSVFGIAMLGFALYYMQPLLPLLDWGGLARQTLALGGLAAVVLGLVIGAVHLSFEYTRWTERLRKAFGVGLCVAGGLALVDYLETPSSAEAQGLVWREDYSAAISEARARQQPLLVDFSASWCGACGELDRHTFTDPRVVRETSRFVTVKVDLSADKATQDKWDLLASYEQRGLPLVVMHNASGDEVQRVTGFMEAEQFVKLLKKVD